LSEPRDPNKYAEDPDRQTPETPAPTSRSQAFMVPEEVEPHQDKGHYNVVSDIKVGHAKVPKFLRFFYASMAVWALGYALFATATNDRTEASPAAEPTVEAGAEAFAASCAGCHNITAERKIGPGLAGVHGRLGDEGLGVVMTQGRPDKGMPAPPTLGLNDKQIQSMILYLKTLK